MEGNTEHEFDFVIDDDHPGLDGHFPGHPVVPAVVLLDQLLMEIEKTWNLQPRRLGQVKFLSPLYPEQRASVRLIRESARVRFSGRSEERLLFSGDFLLS